MTNEYRILLETGVLRREKERLKSRTNFQGDRYKYCVR